LCWRYLREDAVVVFGKVVGYLVNGCLVESYLFEKLLSLDEKISSTFSTLVQPIDPFGK